VKDQVIRYAKEQFGELLDWGKQAVGWGNGSNLNGLTPQKIIDDELKDNAALVEKVRKQYARHDARFDDMSNQEFLTRVVKADKDDIHKLTDVDDILNKRFAASQKREGIVMHEREAAVDGINMNSRSWVVNPLNEWSYGHYKYKDLLTLSDEDQGKMIKEFKTDYDAEIKYATTRLGTEEQATKATLDAVKIIHDQEWGPGGSVSRGPDFHGKVMAQLKTTIDGDQTRVAAAEKAALDQAGINLGDANQRTNLNIAMNRMGHDDINIPPDQMQGNPHANRVIDQFKQDWQYELNTHGGRVDKILAAIGVLHAAPNGENNGNRPLTGPAFKAAVDKQLNLMDSGIDFNNPDHLHTFYRAMTIDPRTRAPTEESLQSVNATLDQQIQAAKAFYRDYEKEIGLMGGGGGGAGKVLDMIKDIDPKYDAADFHGALLAKVTGKPFVPHGQQQEGAVKPVKRTAVDPEGQNLTEAQKFLVEAARQDIAVANAAYAKAKVDGINTAAGQADIREGLKAAAAVAHEKVLAENPALSVTQVKADLEQFKQKEVQMSPDELRTVISNAPGAQTKREVVRN